MQPNHKPENDLTNVRSLLLGDDNEVILKSVKKNARQLVADVITESMYDRQKKDGSLSTTIVPMIESAVEQSIENNKSKFITYLYPIVGGIVRKSVSVFFSGFLEKINYLIEYGLTFKGLKWRIQAWQKGISFSQYILLKTFKFRIEQVFLIHQETGLLLNNVVIEDCQFNDPNLVSSMLTAINDFMIDSFNVDQDESLDIIKTENLTLAVVSGPQAILAVTATGTLPSELKGKLNQTLEEVHSLYDNELTSFNGDNQAFVAAENLLHRCLISEVDEKVKNKSNSAALFIISVAMIASLSAGLFYFWQKHALLEQLNEIQSQPGIHVLETKRAGFNHYSLEVLRDPSSIGVQDWLASVEIGNTNIEIIEQTITSTEPIILENKISNILADEPELKFTLKEDKLTLFGETQQNSAIHLKYILSAIPGITSVDISYVEHGELPTIENSESLFVLLKNKIAALSQYQLSFEVGSLQLKENSKISLDQVKQEITAITMIAQKLGMPTGIIISGYTDNTGNTNENKKLSTDRAEFVKSALIAQGVDKNLLHAVGLGEVNITPIAHASRKVIFSAIYIEANVNGNMP